MHVDATCTTYQLMFRVRFAHTQLVVYAVFVFDCLRLSELETFKPE